jgi:flagellar hook-length control protein FliK
MQFSLLNFLIGLPQVNALANGAAATTGEQGQPADTLFSELLADSSAAGGELAHELVSNLTVAQETTDVVYEGDDTYLANLQGILNRKLSPQRAGELLEQFDAHTGGQHPPEELKEILESVEAGSEPVSVQDILGQVASNQPEQAPEHRANTLQRALQWLQQALTPNSAPMEALAFANAAAMFPEDTATEITLAERGKEKADAQKAETVIPQWVQQIGTPADATTTVFVPMAHIQQQRLPEVELPNVQMAESAPVDEAPTVEDALILVATKDNATHTKQPMDNAFDAFIADLPTEVPSLDTADKASAPLQTETDATPPLTTTAQTATETRTTETTRIHHAHFAYARSEVMDQVNVGVTQAVRDGVNRITIQLNPLELGRVEVKMDIVADGMSQVSFLVDKQETFDLLQRDARTLERMLQDAGVRADSGSMQFNLRQESQSKETWGEASNKTEDSDLDIPTLSTNELPTSTYVHLVSDRIDIRA